MPDPNRCSWSNCTREESSKSVEGYCRLHVIAYLIDEAKKVIGDSQKELEAVIREDDERREERGEEANQRCAHPFDPDDPNRP